MKASEIMTSVIGAEYLSSHPETVDCLKAGDPDREVKKIGTCLTATPEVLRQASAFGADLLITHEPTFYDHCDRSGTGRLYEQKKQAVEAFGGTIYRYHDAMHNRDEDEVNRDLIERMEWKGAFDGNLALVLDAPQTPRELAKALSRVLDIKHPRIIGNPDFRGTNLWLATGARGGYREFVLSETMEIGICGELCEWADGEQVRDAAQLGWHKALIVLGHAASEKLSMEGLAKKIDRKFDGAEAKYFDCGELYTYTD